MNPGAEKVHAIASLTWKRLRETKAATRAAALSFSSLLGMGPFVAIVVIVATWVVGHRSPHAGVVALDRLVHFIAPEVKEYERLGETDRPVRARTQLNPELVDLIDGFVSGAHRGSASVLGGVSLAVILILVFKGIEDALNEIWEVHEARPPHLRVALYGAILGLSALFLAALLLFEAGLFGHFAFQRRHGRLFGVPRWILPLGSAVLMACFFTILYRIVPRAKVAWTSAIVASGVVTILLIVNDLLGALYVRRVVLTRNLYGSLGLAPILLLGLYIFWLYVLIGGHIGYALQHWGENRTGRGPLRACPAPRPN
jgi:membrane protein